MFLTIAFYAFSFVILACSGITFAAVVCGKETDDRFFYPDPE